MYTLFNPLLLTNLMPCHPASVSGTANHWARWANQEALKRIQVLDGCDDQIITLKIWLGKSLPQSLKLLNWPKKSQKVSDTETQKTHQELKKRTPTKRTQTVCPFWGLDFPQASCPKCPQTEHAWRWFRTLLGFGCFLVTDEWQTTSPDPLPSWKPSENHRFLLAKTSKAEPNHRPKPWASTPVAVVEALRLRDQHRVHCTAVNSSSRQWQNITTQHLPFGVPKGDPKGWWIDV